MPASQTAMECPACGSNETGRSCRIEDYEYRIPYQATYFSCSVCRTLFQRPMPDLQALSAFYPAEYHSQTNKGVLSRIKNRMRLKRLLPFLQDGDAVLDYGCGNGAFISSAEQHSTNYQFFGYEIGDHFGKKRLGERAIVIEGTLDDLTRELPFCKLITMNHVIEHLPDPVSTLSKLSEKLVPGGILEGQTPATDSMEHRVFGKYWSGYHAPRHTVIFSTEGLERFLKAIGFSHIQIKGAFNPAAPAVSLASVLKRHSKSGIRREGLPWLFWIGCGTLLAPLDFLSGSPGVIDFLAFKADREYER